MSVKAIANKLGFHISARVGLEPYKNLTMKDVEKLFGYGPDLQDTDFNDWFFVTEAEDVQDAVTEIINLLEYGYPIFSAALSLGSDAYSIVGFKGKGLVKGFDEEALLAFINKNAKIKTMCISVMAELDID